MKVLQKILMGYGLLGFITIFHGIGVAMVVGGWLSVKEQGRAGHGRAWGAKVGGMVAMGFLALWFIAIPACVAFEMGGVGLLAVQLGILVTLFVFAFVPGRASAEGDAGTEAGAKQTIRSRIVSAITPWREVRQEPARPAFWQRLAAASFGFFLGACYYAVLLGAQIGGMDRDWLSHLMANEFLVIHSFPFVSIIALPRVPAGRWRIVQWFLLTSFLSLYLAFSTEGGVPGMIAFVAATFGTYFGFMLRARDPARFAHLVKRWVVGFAVFILTAATTGSRQPDTSAETILMGAMYFVCIGAMEISGLYDRKWVDTDQSGRVRDGRGWRLCDTIGAAAMVCAGLALLLIPVLARHSGVGRELPGGSRPVGWVLVVVGLYALGVWQGMLRWALTHWGWMHRVNWRELGAGVFVQSVGWVLLCLAVFVQDDDSFPSGRGPVVITGAVFYGFGALIVSAHSAGKERSTAHRLVGAVLLTVFTALPVLMMVRDERVVRVTLTVAAGVTGCLALGVWSRAVRRGT
ncbi:MAG: hypothetical protein JXR37_22325 [Kiritimatiellae bacterium]|nr:hypothetical protein [Kiritimatiellia bacterium]